MVWSCVEAIELEISSGRVPESKRGGARASGGRVGPLLQETGRLLYSFLGSGKALSARIVCYSACTFLCNSRFSFLIIHHCRVVKVIFTAIHPLLEVTTSKIILRTGYGLRLSHDGRIAHGKHSRLMLFTSAGLTQSRRSGSLRTTNHASRFHSHTILLLHTSERARSHPPLSEHQCALVQPQLLRLGRTTRLPESEQDSMIAPAATRVGALSAVLFNRRF